MNAPPNQTLYIKNLDDHLSQTRLRESLYTCFSQYGRILDIVSSKARKLRGQAWIVYERLVEATTAMRELNEKEFMGKVLHIAYAKTKSDVVAKQDGTFVPRVRPEKEESVPKVAKIDHLDTPGGSQTKKGSMPKVPTSGWNPPNKILFLDALPPGCTQDMLEVLFQQYHGFGEIRTVPGKADLAFVEFQDEACAGVALAGLAGFQLAPGELLQVNYAKK